MNIKLLKLFKININEKEGYLNCYNKNKERPPTSVVGMNLPKNLKNLLKNFSLYYIIKYIKE